MDQTNSNLNHSFPAPLALTPHAPQTPLLPFPNANSFTPQQPNTPLTQTLTSYQLRRPRNFPRRLIIIIIINIAKNHHRNRRYRPRSTERGKTALSRRKGRVREVKLGKFIRFERLQCVLSHRSLVIRHLLMESGSEKQNKKARFSFRLVLSDWEQMKYQ